MTRSAGQRLSSITLMALFSGLSSCITIQPQPSGACPPPLLSTEVTQNTSTSSRKTPLGAEGARGDGLVAQSASPATATTSPARGQTTRHLAPYRPRSRYDIGLGEFARAAISPLQSNTAGHASLTRTDSGLLVTVDLSSAPPGRHEAAVVAAADCRDIIALLNQSKRVRGEFISLHLGTIIVGTEQNGHLEVTFPGKSTRQMSALIGQTLLVSAFPDRNGQSPVLGCGIISPIPGLPVLR